jgi:hypothetical protein
LAPVRLTGALFAEIRAVERTSSDCRALRTVPVNTLMQTKSGAISVGQVAGRLRCSLCGNAPVRLADGAVTIQRCAIAHRAEAARCATLLAAKGAVGARACGQGPCGADRLGAGAVGWALWVVGWAARWLPTDCPNRSVIGLALAAAMTHGATCPPTRHLCLQISRHKLDRAVTYDEGRTCPSCSASTTEVRSD